MNKNDVINYLKSKKEIFKNEYGIITLGLYGSYARDEATNESDVDIFYERDSNFELKSGLEFMFLDDEIAKELNVKKVFNLYFYYARVYRKKLDIYKRL